MALEGISRHPDLWYDDGTVILIAENIGFRVYRGPLTKHSEVFRDMFSFPQPTAAPSETYEGCPIVRLVGDTAEEIAEVMKILYDGYNRYVAITFRMWWGTQIISAYLVSPTPTQRFLLQPLRQLSALGSNTNSLCYDKKRYGESPRVIQQN